MVLICSTYCPTYLPGARAGKREREGLGTGQPGPLIEKEAFKPRQEGGEGASQEHSGRIACAKAPRWAPVWFAPEAARQSVQLWQQGETYN